MKPHPRIRKTIKWGGAVVTLLLVVVWVASAWTLVGYMSPRGGVYRVTGGAFDCLKFPDWPGAEPKLLFATHDFALQWKPDGVFSPFGFAAPLWIPAALFAGLTALAWRLDTLARRARLNLCPNCHYDRAGLAAGAKCPECGEPPASS
jgi:hypothetical protein